MAATEHGNTRRARRRAADLVSWAAAAGVGAVLAASIAELPALVAGARAANELEHLARSGSDNPVTSVLMNFRGYDTLLEISVLFLAVVGIWSATTMPPRPRAQASPVLRVLEQLLIPFLVLFAVYLLWAGSHEAGGAFQAGAVLAAAGVLIALSNEPPPVHVRPAALRGLLALGLATFLSVAFATALGGRPLLTYPAGYAKPLILLIETAAAASIGATLIVAFRGGRPRTRPTGSDQGARS